VKSIYPILLSTSGVIITYLAVANAEFAIFAVRFYAHFTLVKITTTATKAWAAAQALVNKAMKVFAANPWVAIIGLAVTAVVGLVTAFRKMNAEATIVSRLTGDLSAKINTEQRSVNGLFEAIKKTNPQSEERKRLLQEMNEKYPNFLDYQALEKAGEEELETARRNANDELARSIALEASRDRRTEMLKTISAAEEKYFKAASREGIAPDRINEIITQTMEAADAMLLSDYFKQFGNDYLTRKVTLSRGFGTEVPGWNGKKSVQFPEDIRKTNSALRSLIDVALSQKNAYKGFMDFTGARYGIDDSLMNAVNAGTGGAAPGSTAAPGSSTADTTSAIATGGTKNTTVNIRFGNMVETMNFNGALNENEEAVENRLTELMARILGMAETQAA
jgi:hypothetical protein